jgi:hypothetical protein
MMHLIFTFARIFPALAIPSVAIFIELGIYYRRKASKMQYYMFGFAGTTVFLVLMWLFFRGDVHSDQWIRTVNEAFS